MAAQGRSRTRTIAAGSPGTQPPGIPVEQQTVSEHDADVGEIFHSPGLPSMLVEMPETPSTASSHVHASALCDSMTSPTCLTSNSHVSNTPSSNVGPSPSPKPESPSLLSPPAYDSSANSRRSSVCLTMPRDADERAGQLCDTFPAELSRMYVLRGSLGDGSFAKVRLGVHLLSDTKVAIKVPFRPSLDRCSCCFFLFMKTEIYCDENVLFFSRLGMVRYHDLDRILLSVFFFCCCWSASSDFIQTC